MRPRSAVLEQQAPGDTELALSLALAQAERDVLEADMAQLQQYVALDDVSAGPGEEVISE